MDKEDNSPQFVVTLSGVLHFFSETGTEGGDWAFQDSRHIQKNVPKGFCKKCGKFLQKQEGPIQVTRVYPVDEEMLHTGELLERQDCADDAHEEEIGDAWSYEGLHILKDRDFLRIFSPDNSFDVVWEGLISLTQYESFTEHASGLWIHADQNGVPRETWAEWFFKGYPAKLTLFFWRRRSLSTC